MKPWSWILLVLSGAALVAVSHPFESKCDRFDRLCTEWMHSPSQIDKSIKCQLQAMALAIARNEETCGRALETVNR